MSHFDHKIYCAVKKNGRLAGRKSSTSHNMSTRTDRTLGGD